MSQKAEKVFEFNIFRLKLPLIEWDGLLDQNFTFVNHLSNPHIWAQAQKKFVFFSATFTLGVYSGLIATLVLSKIFMLANTSGGAFKTNQIRWTGFTQKGAGT